MINFLNKPFFSFKSFATRQIYKISSFVVILVKSCLLYFFNQFE